MKLTARNQLAGTVKSVTKGSVNAEVVIEVASGVELTAIVTCGAVDSLGLEAGKPATAIIKASNIMIGVE